MPEPLVHCRLSFLSRKRVGVVSDTVASLAPFVNRSIMDSRGVSTR